MAYVAQHIEVARGPAQFPTGAGAAGAAACRHADQRFELSPAANAFGKIDAARLNAEVAGDRLRQSAVIQFACDGVTERSG